MEQIAQPGIPTQGECDTASRRLPRYLFVVFTLWVCFTTILVGIKTLPRIEGEPPNPFSSYANLFPGQSTSHIELSRFTCTSPGIDDRPTEEPCALSLPTGTFSQVGINMTGGIISQLSLTTREDSLRVGDLMLLWGDPEVQKYSDTVYLFWQSRSIFALARRNKQLAPLWLPILKVYFYCCR